MSHFVTIVSGLPRSGTSLMMQMLVAGGMPALSDGVRASDEDNPRGYLEFEAVKRTKSDASWLTGAPGKAVKMVYLLLRDLPPDYRYRVIMMRRAMQEVLASQTAMLVRSGRKGADVSPERLAAIYSEQLLSIGQWLAAQPNFTVLEIDYRDCLFSAAATAGTVNRFLGSGLNERAMVEAVDTGLYRNRAQRPD